MVATDKTKKCGLRVLAMHFFKKVLVYIFKHKILTYFEILKNHLRAYFVIINDDNVALEQNFLFINMYCGLVIFAERLLK